jgi:8-oxo-dGTP diphosphatase
MSEALERPVKCSVAAVVRSGTHPRCFLAVQRPPDDELLAGVWGLPAITLRQGELPEAGLRRLGWEKLGTALAATRFVGVRAADRGSYLLILMDLEAQVVEGNPDVRAARTTGTAYVDQRWTDDVTLLVPAARRGSVCSRILLEAEGVPF